MGWNIPTTVASLLVGDDATQRAFDGLRRSLQPVLDFCNSTFQTAQDGSLSFVRQVVLKSLNVQGDLSVDGMATVKANADVTGSLVVRGSQIIRGTANNALVVVPGAAGAVLYTTNVGQSAIQHIIYDDGTVWGNNTWTTSSFVSGQGFKQSIHMGTFWNTSTVANTAYALVVVIQNQSSGLSNILRQTTMVRAGSVTGLSVTANNLVAAAGTYSLYKNGVLLLSITQAANAAAARQTWAKGTYKFVAGDSFFVRASYAGVINTATQVDMEIETGA